MLCPRCVQTGKRHKLKCVKSCANDDGTVQIRIYTCTECGIRLKNTEDITDAVILNGDFKMLADGFITKNT